MFSLMEAWQRMAHADTMMRSELHQKTHGTLLYINLDQVAINLDPAAQEG